MGCLSAFLKYYKEGTAFGRIPYASTSSEALPGYPLYNQQERLSCVFGKKRIVNNRFTL